jgi:hypothetical protein
MALVVPFVDNMKRRFLPSGVRKIKWDDPTFARLIQLFGLVWGNQLIELEHQNILKSGRAF